MVGLASAVVGVGLVLFVVGSSRVSSEVVYDDQVPGISLAVLGTVLANAAGVALLIAGRRAVSMRRVAVLGPVPELVPVGRASLDVTPATEPALVGADDLRHYHRESCALAADRDWTARSRAEHERAGRTPCGVCLP
ncbi:hypothetical protein GCM10009547_37010 [Sporichthya brevicatena]|uniref:Uncharacterized protein n=2 Tax=Sporichthya brevicatena TaxID=171442 RepID=A0ABN1H6C4_9ACTN